MTLSNERLDCMQLLALRAEKQNEKDLRFKVLSEIAEFIQESPSEGIFVDQQAPIRLFMQSERELEEIDRQIREAGCDS